MLWEENFGIEFSELIEKTRYKDYKRYYLTKNMIGYIIVASRVGYIVVIMLVLWVV